MKRMRKLLVWLAGFFVGRHPTDAEIVASSRHPERGGVDLQDVATGLFLRWGTFGGDLCAMPRASEIGRLWRNIAIESLQDNDLPTDDQSVDQTLSAWFVAGILDSIDDDTRMALSLSVGRRKRHGDFAN